MVISKKLIIALVLTYGVLPIADMHAMGLNGRFSQVRDLRRFVDSYVTCYTDDEKLNELIGRWIERNLVKYNRIIKEGIQSAIAPENATCQQKRPRVLSKSCMKQCSMQPPRHGREMLGVHGEVTKWWHHVKKKRDGAEESQASIASGLTEMATHEVSTLTENMCCGEYPGCNCIAKVVHK